MPMNSPQSSQPIHFQAAAGLLAEDAARAHLYGLLARLWHREPDEAILKTSMDWAFSKDGAESPLANAWRFFCEHAQDVLEKNGLPDAAHEYLSVFGGIGKAEISLYGSHYLTETYREHTLADLRGELADLGLGRKAEAGEPEDHISGLLDTMRHLVLRGSDDASVEVQARFFNAYLASWYGRFAKLVLSQESTSFYRPVAAVLEAFLDLELEVLR
jgi:TorA maturation chaperone TorD